MAYSKFSEAVAKNPFPNDNIDPSVKNTKKFGLQVAKAIEAKYLFGANSADSEVSRIIENRKWAEGTNDPDEFKSMLNPDSDETYLSLDWSIIPVMPKFIDIAISKIINNDATITFNAIDPISIGERNEERIKFYADIALRPFMQAQKELTGIEIDEMSSKKLDTEEDVEMYMEMGYKQAPEIAMEEAVQFKFDYDHFKQNIEPRVARDLIENKKYCVRLYHDGSCNIRMRYVDIQYYISSFTDQPDNSNSEYCGEIVNFTIRQLREMADSDTPEEHFYKIAQASAGQNKHTWSFGDRFEQERFNSGKYNYDNFLIPCLDFLYFTTDILKYTKKENRYGGFFFDKKSMDYKGPKNPDKNVEVVAKGVQMTYEGIYVVGTDMLISYGKSKNMLRKKTGKYLTAEVFNPYIMFAPNGGGRRTKSVCERMIPIAKQIQLTSLKMQQHLAEAAPPGVAIDQSAILTTAMGAADQKMDGMDMLKLHRQKGSIIYNGMDPETDLPRNGKVIDILPNGLAANFGLFFQTYQFYVNQIREVSALNDVVDGTSPNANDLKGVRDQAITASNNAYRELMNAHMYQLERMGEGLCIMIQDKAQYDPEGFKQEFGHVIGKSGIQELKWLKDLPLRRFGIKAEAKINDEDRAILEGYINRYIDVGELMPEDAFVIRSINNPKKANKYLAYKRNKRLAEMALQKQQEIQAQTEANAQSAIAAAEAEKIKMAAKTESELAIIAAEETKELNLEKLRHENKMAEIDLSGNVKSRHIKEASDESFKREAIASAGEKHRSVGIGTSDDGVGAPMAMPRINSIPEDDAVNSLRV